MVGFHLLARFTSSAAIMKPLIVLTSALFICSAAAIGQKPTINFNGTGMLLASGGSPVHIMAEQDDWPAVLRVCDDLAMDFGRVTGTNGSVSLLSNGTTPGLNSSMIFNMTGRTTYQLSGGSYKNGGVIIAGTIGNSTIVDRLASEGKIEVSAIEGTWEAYISTVVANPMPGVSRATVIAGTAEDARTSLCILQLTQEQAPTVEAQSTACIAYPNRLESHHGTTGQIRRRKSTAPSMLQTLQWCKARRLSSTAASFSMMKRQL